ncbi:ArsO family NAD(P)H-dependent flavin-containing monooxygenase [Nocardioides sp. 1609]|uniref:ArsO family NAD(P)H-dependent flavin-containing monooxygenase n=1 Tax=Nocardioides sp. 1609 TaxID=2508327 RepID=UPI001FD710C4|nr:ArsO family NAD(P)H-dependent flavin-containing monooxygenase [Nocardioides sp. 1609]
MSATPRGGVADVEQVDVAVVGAGQSGLAMGYHLRRLHQRHLREGGHGFSFVLLDAQPGPGGAWVGTWDSLTLFSPASHSSLAGWPMPAWNREGTPSAGHVARYLADYEARYDLPVRRPHRVVDVRGVDGADVADGADWADGRLAVTADSGASWHARVVVNATGSWSRPFWPAVPGAEVFGGRQLHAADYRAASDLAGANVLVVGGGNSGAQVAADLLLHAGVAGHVTWATRGRPRFLPDDVDGRVLFEVASQAVRDRAAGRSNPGVGGLGDVVAVPAVRQARDHHGLRAVDMPRRLTESAAVWDDGTTRELDVIVWCTGFRPALRHLHPLRLSHERGHPTTTAPTHDSTAAVSTDDPRLWFLGYGDWCAPGSATLIGVNRPARDTAAAVVDRLRGRTAEARPSRGRPSGDVAGREA